MKRIVLTTVGTTGDVLPYVALARGLAARGHQVRACSHDVHRAHFERHGIDFVAAGPPFDVGAFNRTIDEIARIPQPFKQFELLAERVFLAEPKQQLQDHLEASKGADLVVTHWFDYVAQEAAIANGVPWVAMTYMPEILRTAEAPVYPYPRLGKWWTKLTWDSVEQMAAPLTARIRALLASLGGAPRPLAIVGALSPRANLLAVSRHLVEVRGDWPATVHVTGSWFASEESYVPPPELTSFLDRHPSPIVVTFGSMGGTLADTRSIVSGALARVRRGAIVQRGYAGLSVDLGEHVFVADYVPHDWLFPRAGCVVHHAGSGTAAAAARAGVPSVPVPHLFDQYYWAGMLHRRGAAPKPLFRAQLTAKALAARLDEALGSTSMRERAAQLGAEIRAEDGVLRAIEHIEAQLAGQP